MLQLWQGINVLVSSLLVQFYNSRCLLFLTIIHKTRETSTQTFVCKFCIHTTNSSKKYNFSTVLKLLTIFLKPNFRIKACRTSSAVALKMFVCTGWTCSYNAPKAYWSIPPDVRWEKSGPQTTWTQWKAVQGWRRLVWTALKNSFYTKSNRSHQWGLSNMNQHNYCRRLQPGCFSSSRSLCSS